MFKFLRPSVKNRALSSRLGSLILLFQRSPLVQIFFPEARMLGGAGLGEITKWTIATVAGLGAYDTVTGATALIQNIPNQGLSTVAATAGSGLTFVFQCTGSPAAPKLWTVGPLPNGLIHSNLPNMAVHSITGTPTVSGSFSVKITAWRNSTATGDFISKTFTINIAPAPVTAPGITGQPASVTINSGGTATFSASASGTSPGFQWYIGGSGDLSNPIGGANSSSYTTPSLYGTTAYWVRASNSAGAANSNTAIATVITPPNFTTQPTSVTLNSGGTTTFNVALGGSASNLQWYRGNAGDFSNPIGGANSTSYTTPGLNADTAYWVQASNSAGSANSYTAIVTVITPPAFSTQPASVTLNSGGTATFTVAASGTAPTFQWFLGNSGDTSNPVTTISAVSAVFTTAPLTASANYWVRATNSAGTADSTTASATVVDPFTTWTNSAFPPTNVNNPLITGPTADPDGDGITNANEYLLGLSPLVANPSPAPVPTLSSGEISLKFTARAATGPGYTGRVRRYTLESNDTLASTAWTPVTGYTDILASDQAVTYTTSNAGPKRFYRLSVTLTP